MTADEVIVRFKDKIAQWSPELRKAFVACDQKNKGYITKKAFRKVKLLIMGLFYLTLSFGIERSKYKFLSETSNH